MNLSQENQTEIQVFITLMNLNVLISMKHFIEMIMMTNLVIHAIVVPLQTAAPHLKRNIRKEKKSKKFQRKGRKQKRRTKILSSRKRMKLLQKERVI